MTKDEQGRLTSRIGTVFPGKGVLITSSGIHAWQRLQYLDILSAERQAAGLPALTPEEEAEICAESVDLIFEPQMILIRPDPENMRIAFEADDVLQEIASKRAIKFLHATNDKVRQAIKARGECWRVSPLPQSAEEMKKMIWDARVPIGGQTMYYYNRITGTRFLTYHEFSRLESLPPRVLARELQEIGRYAKQYNHLHQPEVDFFPGSVPLEGDDFMACQFEKLEPSQLLQAYQELKARFQQHTPPELRLDNPESLAWRQAIFKHLVAQKNEIVAEEILRGLSPEFYLQIEWLPGGRFEEGELVFDSIFDEQYKKPGDPDLQKLCDPRVKGFIFNFLREFGEIEYINIGRVSSSLSQRPKATGRRDVYMAELKLVGEEKPTVRFIRMQKWGIREHLDENKDLLASILEAEEYTEYILNRRVGCLQLGMNLVSRISIRRLNEVYNGPRREFQGRNFWASYFERDYIPGVATDKLTAAKFAAADYALRFAGLLGQAAAPNIIVGRMDLSQHVLFDDGDEVVVEDDQGMPVDMLVSDLTGAFTDYDTDLIKFAPAYAEPIRRRLAWVTNPEAFAETYASRLQAEILRLQNLYHNRKRAFDSLFKHCPRDEHGSFAFRWEHILERLDQTDVLKLCAAIRAEFAAAISRLGK
jgi:hypothetical protein